MVSLLKFLNKRYCVYVLKCSRQQTNKFNKIKNITVFRCALGAGLMRLDWSNIKKELYGLSLKHIIKCCGGHVDFLKCDCEGGEWSISPDDLKGIRRIEIEVHDFDGKHPHSNFFHVLDQAGFSYTYNIVNSQITLIHAKSKVII